MLTEVVSYYQTSPKAMLALIAEGIAQAKKRKQSLLLLHDPAKGPDWYTFYDLFSWEGVTQGERDRILGKVTLGSQFFSAAEVLKEYVEWRQRQEALTSIPITLTRAEWNAVHVRLGQAVYQPAPSTTEENNAITTARAAIRSALAQTTGN